MRLLYYTYLGDASGSWSGGAARAIDRKMTVALLIDGFRQQRHAQRLFRRAVASRPNSAASTPHWPALFAAHHQKLALADGDTKSAVR